MGRWTSWGIAAGAFLSHLGIPMLRSHSLVDDPTRKGRVRCRTAMDVDVDGAVDVAIDVVFVNPSVFCNSHRCRQAPTFSTTTTLPRCAPTTSMLSLPTRATAAAWSPCGSLA
ncbi:hypothetical protein B0H14DRAFT_3024863 [Mycena olivaceomarginata]|nr:hypothetical protein B0H14DRAFT_3024863 [Mycena olivaceomarginata]